jgi:hypothetical protein
MKTLIVNYGNEHDKDKFKAENAHSLNIFGQVVYVNDRDANGVNVLIVESN